MEGLRLIESQFKPKFQVEHAITTRNIEISRKSVNGYARLFVQDEIDPLDIIEMILTFHGPEWVHFF